MQAKEIGKEAALREGMLSFLQESTKRVLSQFAGGQLFDDINAAYSGGLIGGFYGKETAIAQHGRGVVRDRVRALKKVRSRQEYRRMVVTIYRLGLQHGKAIKTGDVLSAGRDEKSRAN